MNIAFLLICTLSVLFFAVFLLECSRPLRKSRGTPVVRKSSGTVSGPGGVTPPGGNTGPPGSVVPGFTPDLRKTENRLDMALMVMF